MEKRGILSYGALLNQRDRSQRILDATNKRSDRNYVVLIEGHTYVLNEWETDIVRKALHQWEVQDLRDLDKEIVKKQRYQEARSGF